MIFGFLLGVAATCAAMGLWGMCRAAADADALAERSYEAVENDAALRGRMTRRDEWPS